MAQLVYREMAPSAGLSHAIDCLWSVRITWDGSGTPSHWVLPDGSYSLAVGIKGSRYIHLRKPALVPFRAPCRPGEEIVGIRFRPGIVPFNGLHTIRRKLRGELTADEVFAALEQSVRVEAPDSDRRIDQMITLIRESDGRIALPEAAETVRLSQRHLERLCRSTVGLSPKGFARVTRLQAVVRRLIAKPEIRLADCAAEYGFTDQTHMTREFSALGQLTPAAYLRMIRDVGFLLETPPRNA